MAVDPQHRFLYVGQRRSRQISSYSIQSGGELRLLATIDVRSDPNFMITDRTGTFLLSSYYRGEGVHVHAVRDDGSLEPEAVEWQDTALSAHSFQTDPGNRFAYALHIAAGVGPNAIWQYRFDAASGRLCPIDPPLVHARNEAGPRHCCFHPRLPLLYACNEQGSSVTRYRYDPTTGALSEEDTVSMVPAGYTGTSGCTQIRITTDGRLLFAPLGGPDSMVSFVVDDGGVLRVSGHAPTEAGPRAFGLDAGERLRAVHRHHLRRALRVPDRPSRRPADPRRTDAARQHADVDHRGPRPAVASDLPGAMRPRRSTGMLHGFGDEENGMKLILIGCEYAGTTTLAIAFHAHARAHLGIDLGSIHDHWKIPYTVTHHPDEITEEEADLYLALSTRQKEAWQRHNLYYHTVAEHGEPEDQIIVGFYIEDTIYADLYYGYGGPGEAGDRAGKHAPSIEGAPSGWRRRRCWCTSRQTRT